MDRQKHTPVSVEPAVETIDPGEAHAPVDVGPGLDSIRFAQLGQRLSETAREAGYAAPTFRSPPRVAGARRTLQRRPDGTVSVAVAVRGRPLGAVVADMVDGVVAANRPTGTGRRQGSGRPRPATARRAGHRRPATDARVAVEAPTDVGLAALRDSLWAQVWLVLDLRTDHTDRRSALVRGGDDGGMTAGRRAA